MRIAVGLGGAPFIAMVAVVAAGCFGNSTSNGPHDSGVTIPFDSGFTPDSAHDAAFESSSDGSFNATLPTGTIDFGLVDCGTQPAAKTYSFQNTGTEAIKWSAAVDSVFALQGATSGTVAAGATGSLTIGASSVPTTSPPGVAIAGTLTLTTNVPGFATVKVPLQLTPQGGSLVLTPPLVGLGTSPVNTPASLAFVLQNVGNAAVGVTFGSPTDPEFSLTYTGAPAVTTLPPGGSLAGGSATFTAASVGAKTATAAIQATGALCNSAATSVSLSGTGTPAPVSIGPSPLNFATAPCGGAAAPPQTVTLKSMFGSSITFTASLGLGAASPYKIDATSGTVAAGGQATIQVSPLPIPVPGNITPGFYDDTLTVTTTAPGATPVVIPLQESASGAVLALTMATGAFGTVSNTTATLPFTVTNTGNADATVAVATTGTNFAAVLTGSDVVTAGGTSPGNASFTAKTNAAATGTLTVSATSGAVCNVPTAIALSATGAVPVLSYAASTQLALGAICGGALTPATLPVQNTGNAPLTLSNITTTSPAFTVSPPTSTLGPSIATVITANPVAPALGTAAGGSSVSGTITFSTNEVGHPSYTVPVTVAYHGANLSFVGGSLVTVSVCNGFPFAFQNTGDMSASVYVSGPYVGDGPFLFGGKLGTTAPGTTVGAGGGTAGDTVGRNLSVVGCSGSCIYSGTETYTTLGSTGTAAGVCIPLPTLDLSLNLPSCGNCC